ncbi:glycosyltransferase family 4 protein [Sulfitobacter sp. KE34]|uniref:Glycosyltransferase family 1 protein n=1 Tax=Sulfitobacter faviae TaxID=1775881 RepID=A0AAX3LNS3_9RHOB|nr:MULTISPECIES: glycosyltransferase family 1 protein [Sulfitobacter]MDF3375465.1 glycosyltransferase family 4 protein [Sulfitobacter sp. KE37]MDF3436613.1 glycosyltransferase family 4 protein [Sulfitobacter sp. Ks46]MDF3353499.1 glycosyltransferase family 4 protein [Sulfitobacter sp. KE27]MDF3357146.1 glycosyltransferase family 4 protein [Sulfitobacter sp. KE33]MDF3361507.1 glycosyltransferase family 4 protein [Sulfitobacter sp. Ks41]
MQKPQSPPARLLDLTRSLRRVGRGATGVDRVELAYLSHLLTEDAPLFGVARTALGYALLDRDGMRGFQDRLAGRVPWGRADLLSCLLRGRTVALSRAESDLRRLAVARCVPARLPAMLARHLPPGFAYLNVGHSNLTDRVLGAVKQARGRSAVLIHDVIPLEYPAYQRPGTVAPFRAKIDRVSAQADLVIYNSQDTRQRSEAQMRGRIPLAVVAHLGVDLPAPDAGELPAGLPPERPYFVIVGTIEPRKNHGFLLDLWQKMGPDAPLLLICGARGWNNSAVFDRLDRLPENGPVQELANLSDKGLAALVQGAAGMLFPSHAEGFGLPPAEALSLGTRVLCNDLPVLHEVLGDKAVYAPLSEPYSWIRTIEEWAASVPDPRPATTFIAPTWAEHFKTVLKST